MSQVGTPRLRLLAPRSARPVGVSGIDERFPMNVPLLAVSPA